MSESVPCNQRLHFKIMMKLLSLNFNWREMQMGKQRIEKTKKKKRHLRKI
uniref:Uncharacterized protein n=1 Tax=Arundo donax TaxID=35708 RepID=A0A0A9EPP3_ARUDO